MRAVQLTEFGGPEVLELVELDVPEPAEDQGLIRVSRAGVNFADTHQRENAYIAKQELPLVPGGEVVGVVERGGGELSEGTRVVAMTGGRGGYAEYALAPAATTFPLPDGVDDGTALALLIQGLTAWHLFRTSAQLRPGESVVVHSAAGGVGSLALQLAKPFGAGRAIATASSEDKRAAGFWFMHCLQRPQMLREPLRDLYDRAARGELRTVVGGTYPLSDVRRVHEDLVARRTSGKLVIDPSS